jgi:hypothetical protein
LRALAALLLLATGPLIRAEGTGGCPSAGEVSARLAGLLGPAVAADPPEVLQMTVAPAGLRLRLWRADGTLVAERTIVRTERCAEMAETAAVLTAAWEADLRPGLVRMPAPVRREPPAPPPGGPVYEVGAVPALWVGGGGPALGGAIRGGVWSRQAPLGMTLALAAAFPTGQAGDGWARWRRYALSAGVMGRLQHETVFLDALAETVLGWLVARSDGQGETGAAFDPGLSLALRAGAPLSRRMEVAALLGLWGAALRLGNGDGKGKVQPGVVPRWGVLLGVGASVRLGE